MKAIHRIALIVLLSLIAAAVAGVVAVKYWAGTPPAQRTAPIAAADQPGLVDEQPFLTAQKLAALAKTPDERELAQEAVRVADHELELTFTSALRNVTLHPPTLTPAARDIVAHIDVIQDQVKAEATDVERLNRLIAQADADKKIALEEELRLEQAVLNVDQGDLDVARQELIRVGGDPRSIIQRLMDEHAGWHQRQGAAANAPAAESRALTAEPVSQSLVAQFQAWRRLSTTGQELSRAGEEAGSRAASLDAKRQVLRQAATGSGPGEASDQQAPNPLQAAATAASQESQAAELFSILNRVAEEQKQQAELDKRIQELQQLQAIYGNWSGVVAAAQRVHVVRILESVIVILAMLLLVVVADPLLRVILSRVARDNKRLLTVRSVARFVTQAVGIAVILLVIFGPPNQLATVVALAGAGLTVALKDFIVGFFGWFTLMGRNGIRPGDWVEINGIGGEVLEVGLVHTVLLETGNWSDAGHPTGRKVTFVNSFAIEGHYFNFSTSGQWLWDELQAPIPSGADPYPIAEAVQRIVTEETQPNMRLAEQEWQRVVPTRAGRTFSAAPAISVQPTSLGVNVIVRYITRAQERYEVRSRLYHRIVEVLRGIPEGKITPAGEALKSMYAKHS
jgi:small-conductance mechanosensitive channel